MSISNRPGGDINRSLVSNRLIPANRIPLICRALKSRQLLEENHAVLESVVGPASGLSSTVVYTYRLEAPKELPTDAAPEPMALDRFAALHGILRSAYEKLGGAEAFHARERAEWER
jgi:hypothetical protein